MLRIQSLFAFLVFSSATVITSSAQNWIIPTHNSPVTATSKIGITGTSATPRHLQISADNASEIQFYTGTPSLQRMSIDNNGVVYISSLNNQENFTNRNLHITTIGGGTGGQGGWWVRNAAILIGTQFPSTKLAIGCGGEGIFYMGNNASGESLITLSLDANTAVTGTFNAISKAVIGTAISNVSPTDALEIATLGDQYIRFTRVIDTTNSQSYFGTSGIKFANGASITQSIYRNYGSGSLVLTNGETNGASISLYGSTINFGGNPGAGNSAGVYNFNNLLWSQSLFVSDYSGPGPGQGRSMPAGYKFAVHGQSNFLDKVVIGNTSAFTKGIPATGYKLCVADGILAEKVKCAIKTTDNWSDFVFAPDYKLMDLKEVEKYIGQNKHLPGIPSADEVVKNGVDLGQMDALLLQKIEELTLHMIRLEKKNEQLEKENAEIRLQLKKK